MPLKYDNSACDIQYLNDAIIYLTFFAIISVPFLFILDLFLVFCLFFFFFLLYDSWEQTVSEVEEREWGGIGTWDARNAMALYVDALVHWVIGTDGTVFFWLSPPSIGQTTV